MKNTPKINEGDFKKVINVDIKKGRHADYLQHILESYEWYKKGFSALFAHEENPEAVYVFKVIYKNKKKVWRTLEIKGKQTFEQLAKGIVRSMGWDYDHMHGFTVPNIQNKPANVFDFSIGTRLEFFAPDWEDDPFPTYKSDQISIFQFDHRKYPTLDFIFDFGDGHEFDIQYKGMRKQQPSDRKKKFPCIVQNQGLAPEQYPKIQ